jgi:twitching motility protein PilT
VTLPTAPPPEPVGTWTTPTAGSAAITLREILQAAVAQGASDIHVRAGAAPLLRVAGDLQPLAVAALTAEDAGRLLAAALPSEREAAIFEADRECDFALVEPGVGRFRVNAYRSRGSDAMVLRHVKESVPSFVDLGLPSVVHDMALATSGLILVCGPTGSGKTTTLAAMIDAINGERRCHILTIEDPIEFLHQGRLATISQRELHTDTFDFARALRSGMRQDPDVILIGEIRDTETMRTALQAAQTGHLVLASLHAKSAIEAVNRVIDLFPVAEQRQARLSLAESIRGVLCQHLVRSASGNGRMMLMEIAVATPRVRETIADEGKVAQLGDIVAEGEFYGMRTFQQDAVRLVMSGAIDVDAAESVVPSPADFRLALKRAGFHG